MSGGRVGIASYPVFPAWIAGFSLGQPPTIFAAPAVPARNPPGEEAPTALRAVPCCACCAEKQEYIDHIQEIVSWLGWKPWKVRFCV